MDKAAVLLASLEPTLPSEYYCVYYHMMAFLHVHRI